MDWKGIGHGLIQLLSQHLTCVMIVFTMGIACDLRTLLGVWDSQRLTV